MKLIAPKIPAFCVALLAGCGGAVLAAEEPQRFDYKLSDVPTLDAAWALVKRSTEANAWKLVEKNLADGKSRRIVHERVGAPVRLTLGQMMRLETALTDPTSLAIGAKLCGFNPVAEVEFVSGEKKVAVQFCFGCGEITVAIEGRGGMFTGMNAMGQPRFLALIKEIFPQDELIQSIGEPRGKKPPAPPVKA